MTVVDTSRENIQKMSGVIYLSTDDDQGSRRKIDGKEQRDQRRKTHSLSLYSKIFDYSLGGYYHQER
jgi:hypothetical protein